MRTVFLCLGASLLLTVALVPRASRAVDLSNSHQRWDTTGPYSLGSDSGSQTSCPIKLRPSGQCGSSGAGAEDEDCPYQLTLPPLTIQLPKQFRLLEKTMKELQSLKEVVNKLKSGCQDCRSTRSNVPTGYQQADQGRSQVPDNTEDGDGMVNRDTTDGTGQGQGPAVGKITPVPSNLQEMQVRILLTLYINAVDFKMST